MKDVKGIIIKSLDGQKVYGIEDSEVREELANVVDGAPEELDSFKEAFEKFKEGSEALSGITANVAELGEAVANETMRAKVAEQALDKAVSDEVMRSKMAENNIKDNALQYNKIGFTANADRVQLYAKNINDDKVRYDDIPAATTESAGVMSAEDKKRVLKVDVHSSISRIMAKSNTFATASFTGGVLLNENGEKGFYRIGDSLSASPYINPNAEPVVKYKSKAYSTTIGLRLKKGSTEEYRWAALYDGAGNIVVELACDAPNTDYIIGLPKEWTIVSSCATYLNPEIVDLGETFSNIDDRFSDINNNIIYNLQPVTAIAVQEFPKIPFSQHGYIRFTDGMVSAAGLTSGATPYISVEGVEMIHTTAVVSASGAKIAFYDKELNYLDTISISGADPNTDYVFTEEQKKAAYFRVSYYGASDSDKTSRSVLKLTFSDGRIPAKDLNGDIQTIKSEVLDLELNSKGLTFTDYFDLANSNFGKYKLHQVTLKAGSTVTFKVIKSDATFSLTITYKDSSVSAIATDVKTGSVIEFTPEKDVEYFGYYLFKVEGNSNAEVTIELLPRQVLDIEKFTDKPQLDILIFGDSITQSHATIEYKSIDNPYSINVSGLSGTNWAKILEQTKQLNNSYRLGEIRNYAKSGASFRDRLLEPRQYLGFQIDEAFADLNAPEDGYYHNKPFNPDVVIVSIGTNDGTPASADTYDSAMSKSVMKDVVIDGVTRQQIDIQETLNNLDTKSTIGEAIRHSYMRLREKFPNALFVYATPIQRLAYETPPTQLELFKSLAKRYNFVIADCNSESGIVRDYQTWDGSSGDLRDGLHPTENGSKKILRCIMDTVINNIQYLP